MAERKRRKSRIQKNRKRKIIIIVRYMILLVMITILSYMAYGIYREGKIRTLSSTSDMENLLTENETKQSDEINEDSKQIIMPAIPVIKNYSGYEVDSRLEVPKINLNTNVLSNYSTAGLDICASKYYGPDANEIGNYCIAGHNYQQQNMFNHLIDLEVGDSIFLTDNQNGIVEYQVYDIYKVKPQNTAPLSQETKGKRELTLITCVNYSKNRLVVKAVEIS